MAVAEQSIKIKADVTGLEKVRKGAKDIEDFKKATDSTTGKTISFNIEFVNSYTLAIT